jgi:hypothetical protein
VKSRTTESERIQEAQRAARCQYLKYNGEGCGCPALKGKSFCRFHDEDAEYGDVGIPFINDAAALQLAIMRVLRSIELGRLDNKKATAELYALQLAANNLRLLREEMPADPAEAGRSLTERLMRILDPPIEKYALVHQEVRNIVGLL